MTAIPMAATRGARRRVLRRPKAPVSRPADLTRQAGPGQAGQFPGGEKGPPAGAPVRRGLEGGQVAPAAGAASARRDAGRRARPLPGSRGRGTRVPPHLQAVSESGSDDTFLPKDAEHAVSPVRTGPRVAWRQAGLVRAAGLGLAGFGLVHQGQEPVEYLGDGDTGGGRGGRGGLLDIGGLQTPDAAAALVGADAEVRQFGQPTEDDPGLDGQDPAPGPRGLGSAGP